jgi:phosphoribosylanthranilate isomerase
MKERYIGVTGITTKEDVQVMTKALDGHLGMYGVLMSPHTLEGGKCTGRWANLEDIPGLMAEMPKHALRTIHWCDGTDREKIVSAVDATDGYCNAIQLNLVYPSPDIFRMLKEKYNLTNIFQIEKCMFEDPIIMKKKMEPYVGIVDYVLIDQSMGAGKLLDAGISKAVASVLKDLGFGITHAGGLNGKRILQPPIPELIIRDNASTDAEGQLLNYNDKLDHTAVVYYIDSAKCIMQSKK